MPVRKQKIVPMKAIIYRWLDLIALSITTILLCAILQPATNILGGNFNKLLNLWHWSILLAIAVLLSTIIWFILSSLGGVCFRCFWRNPPVWLVAIISFVVYVLLYLYLFENNNPENVSAVGIVLIIFGIGGTLALVI